LARALLLVLTLPWVLIACATTAAKPPAAESVALELPAALESERSAYEREVGHALAAVASCFNASGARLPEDKLIDSAIIFASTERAREQLARTFETAIENLPTTFAGTVVERRLYLVSRQAYRATWQTLYADWPWTDATYQQLLVHELAHRAHEAIALSRAGSSDAMGPLWFFEGLAVVCAGQFDDQGPLLDRAGISAHLGPGHTPAVSYPLYGQLVRSLLSMHDMETLLNRAAEPGFPESLWSATPMP
jgi:hypothetical protein